MLRRRVTSWRLGVPTQRGAATCLGAATQQRSAGSGGGGRTPGTVFHEAADAYIDKVMAVVEAAADKAGENLEDVEFSDGVLSVQTSRGTFVLNKQAPKLQLWLSSPVSGPAHYDMSPAADVVAATVPPPAPSALRWASDRDGHRLDERLTTELSGALGVPVEC